MPGPLVPASQKTVHHNEEEDKDNKDKEEEEEEEEDNDDKDDKEEKEEKQDATHWCQPHRKVSTTPPSKVYHCPPPNIFSYLCECF